MENPMTQPPVDPQQPQPGPYPQQPPPVYIQRQPAGCGKIALVMVAVMVGLGLLALVGFIAFLQLT